jgi:hypothetical protein
MFVTCLIANRRTSFVLNRTTRASGAHHLWSTVLTLPVSLTPKLRVTGAQTEYMPLYLRTFVRLLSSWVHGIYQHKRLPDDPRAP